MDEPQALSTLAEVAATFIGFTGVVFAVLSFAGDGIRESEKGAIVHLVLPSVAALIFSLLPLILIPNFGGTIELWRACNLALGLVHLGLLSHGVRSFFKQKILGSLLGIAVLTGFGLSSISANLLVTYGLFQDFAVSIYLAGLLWLLIVSATQFILLFFGRAHAA